ncbi:hypothetical protein RHGRI_006238 [Rhododendron griersonianum]|uniref:RING-type domain-containing protein n=1 Tax=Rhododendron griersonianum TaxID=479676 RepID=A0AAV6KS95_9ERIC|nr:hypothetical protein RHGRI_006238 [Rhododendron griersonianum]
MTPVCPFVKAARPDEASLKNNGESQTKHQSGQEVKAKQESGESATISPKCPFGYDSETFKLGPFSCMICQALLYESSKCVPCSHVYCKACISRFKDCPLCGADIEKIEPDTNLQNVVDQFIEGHARIKRSQVDKDQQEAVGEKKTVIYEDVSLERGAFLVQQAMRAFRAQNVESAKSRLSVCAEDIREQLERMGTTSELCSQLGAVLGMLGDCWSVLFLLLCNACPEACRGFIGRDRLNVVMVSKGFKCMEEEEHRALGDASSAITYFEESVNFLKKVPPDDLEIIHTLSVSLNKVGDLKYYDEDLQGARSYYFQSLNVRRDAIKSHPSSPSQILDVAVSLAKVADVDRNLGNEDVAVDEFQEAIKLLDRLTLKPEEVCLEQRRLSVLEFLKNQLSEKQPDSNP